MIGYKIFREGMICRGHKFEVGNTYEIYEEPKICDIGYHFCTTIKDALHYFKSQEKRYNREFGKYEVAIVEAIGDIDKETRCCQVPKFCTNKLVIKEKLSQYIVDAVLEREHAVWKDVSESYAYQNRG